jgi:hypothetical protein
MTATETASPERRSGKERSPIVTKLFKLSSQQQKAKKEKTAR